jgi:S1-C subfamily serine protease
MMNFDGFISYPHQNKAVADAACATLEAAGIRCWIAPRDVEPGADWAGAIVDAIDHCRVMILIFSSHANRSKQVHREVQRAFDREVPVVPFRIENVVPDKTLSYYMASVHWLDALTPPLEQHLDQLAKSVRSFLQTELGSAGEAGQPQAAINAAIDDTMSTPQGGAASLNKDPGLGQRHWLFGGVAAGTIALCGLAWVYLTNHSSQGTLPLSPSSIFRKFANSTAFIEVRSSIYDQDTGKQVYEKIVTIDGVLYPAFVRLPDGTIAYWLTLDDGSRHNLPLQQTVSGSGFVINEQGYLLTSKQLAASWLVPYNGLSENGYQSGAIYTYASKKSEVQRVDDFFQNLRYWSPADGGPVFSNDNATYLGGVSDKKHTFIGRDDVLGVRFPGDRTSISASLVSASTEAEAALIKIQAARKLTAVETSHDDKVEVGDKVVVIGYPAVITVNISLDKIQAVYIPEPTLAEGIVTRMESPIVTVSSTTLDTILLSINSAGRGNRGSPVFNEKGHVVGLFGYYLPSFQGTAQYFAVPIKHGLDLLPQRVGAN